MFGTSSLGKVDSVGILGPMLVITSKQFQVSKSGDGTVFISVRAVLGKYRNDCRLGNCISKVVARCKSIYGVSPPPDAPSTEAEIVLSLKQQ